MPSPRFTGLRASSTRARAAARGASKKSGTRPERLLRQAIWRAGRRYRKNVAYLPGKPDVVFTRARLAVFCDGDFWHGNNWPERKRKLEGGHNAAYWIAKIERNVERDRENDARLAATGWRVLRFWESEIRADPARVAARVVAVLDQRLPHV